MKHQPRIIATRPHRVLRIVVIFAAVLSTVQAHAGNWVPLFDGLSLRGWTDQSGEPVKPSVWQVENGTMHLDVSQGRGGNILSHSVMGDFELVFEWKIAPRSNSGIKYRVKDFEGRVLGLEYQIIDDENYGTLRPNQKTAALYDLVAPRPHTRLRPPGEFNRGAIVVRGCEIEHWLNGYRVVHVIVGSRDWRDRIAASKFADVNGFGENSRGQFMLTDHGDEVWYRNVFYRSLNRCR